MIYLNNAATTYPKPQCVLEAHAASLYLPPVAQFRSSDTVERQDIFMECREKLGELFGIKDWERIYFSSGATDSLNQIIYGLNLKGKHVIATQTEHNSVLRPLYNLYADDNGIGTTITVIPCDKRGKINVLELEASISPDTAAIFVSHCSNVTGMVQNLKEIGQIAKKHNLTYVVDASQSAGCIEIKADDWDIDILVFTGHKSLFGVQGTGGHYVKKNVMLRPMRYGGTGRDSLLINYENEDYEYEVGTQNTPGITAMLTGVNYILNRGLHNIIEKEYNLIKKIYDGLNAIQGVTVYGDVESNHGPVVSFNFESLKASDVAYILQNSFDIIVRTGHHCSPLIHQKLGTLSYGTVRISISDMTKEDDIDKFLSAVESIQMSM